jgi:hypothetical protein
MNEGIYIQGDLLTNNVSVKLTTKETRIVEASRASIIRPEEQFLFSLPNVEQTSVKDL